jgi:hypothetical protein
VCVSVWHDSVKLGNEKCLFVKKEMASPTFRQLRSLARTDVISVGTCIFVVAVLHLTTALGQRSRRMDKKLLHYLEC